MAENQNIEWKESWRDEYLKWICGFANAQGGKIYVGVDDSGKVIGVADAKKLLEDIPNKITQTLGIVAEVNLLQQEGKDYLEVVVPVYHTGIKS
ncbi:MAG: helix-turn-helix domain-containing protein [Anaerovibrio sp.]